MTPQADYGDYKFMVYGRVVQFIFTVDRTPGVCCRGLACLAGLRRGVAPVRPTGPQPGPRRSGDHAFSAGGLGEGSPVHASRLHGLMETSTSALRSPSRMLMDCQTPPSRYDRVFGDRSSCQRESASKRCHAVTGERAKVVRRLPAETRVRFIEKKCSTFVDDMSLPH